MLVTASSSVRNEAVSAPFRIVRQRSPLLVLSFLFLLLSGTAYSQQTKKQAPPVSKRNSSVTPAANSGEDELLRRLQAQRAAVSGGDAAAVELASQRVTALALRRVAALRALAGAWPQAIDLYRQSLDLEDVASARVELAMAYMSASNPDGALQEVDKALVPMPRTPAPGTSKARRSWRRTITKARSKP